MKILIVSLYVGGNAAGIVFEQLIRGLCEINTVDVLTSRFSPAKDIEKLNKVISFKYLSINPRLSKLLISTIGINPLDLFFSHKASSLISQQYDIVLGFVAGGHYTTMISASLISNKFKSKFAVFCVDALPAPLGWSKNNSFYHNSRKLVQKHLKKIDYLASANQNMLSYQLEVINPQKDIISDVIYNPSECNNIWLPFENNGCYVFLYTGCLYGARNPHYILSAFKQLLLDIPDSKLVFVGTEISDSKLAILDEIDRYKVEFYPFTKDLTPFYKIASVLLDIDADLENDVFLSSKVINYLCVNRMIICETGINSPSRQLFKNISSIIQCDHNSNQLYMAMKKAISLSPSMDYSDRDMIINQLSVKKMTEKMDLSFKTLFN